MTERALADPRGMVSADPLADAWGLEPGSMGGVTNFEQSLPERDLLYLDKAWSLLQRLTAPAAGDAVARPAYRMFEGQVTPQEWGWSPWVRALTPVEVIEIARDLESIDDADAQARFREAAGVGRDPEDEARYGSQYLSVARAFTTALADDGRGMVYLIG
ncbi:YfbM family protein [Agrococcus sp. ARC_14]|nr:YfbM family protein [Agrococcus sp. ARC_14]